MWIVEYIEAATVLPLPTLSKREGAARVKDTNWSLTAWSENLLIHY